MSCPSAPLRIAMLAPYPARAVLAPDRIKPRYRNREHAAPWIRSLCGSLSERSEVVVQVFVHSRAVTHPCETEDAQGFPIVFVPKREPIRTDPFHGFWPGRCALRPWLRRFQPDIVHGFGTEGGYGVIAVHQPQPSVIFVQGIQEMLAPFYDYSSLRVWARQRYERLVMQRVRGVVAETQFAADWARSLNAEAVIRVIPHGVDAAYSEVRSNPQSTTFLSIGSMVRQKGPDTVLRAFALCASSHARLVLIGDGHRRLEYEALAAALNVADRVSFTGQLSQAEVMRHMADARALVIASRMDTSPNVITEAHAAGLPVIGTRAGGIPEMINDGEDGYLVDIDDADAMAERMHHVLSDADTASRLGVAGRKKVRVLNDPARIAEEHIRLYRDLVNE